MFCCMSLFFCPSSSTSSPPFEGSFFFYFMLFMRGRACLRGEERVGAFILPLLISNTRTKGSLLVASTSANQSLSHLGFKGTVCSYFEPRVYGFILTY